jgi:hypothetical protein
MGKDDEEKYEEILKRLSSSSEKWLQIRKVLEDEIIGNRDLIDLIDKKVKEDEDKISRLN